jgi:ribosomal-protein-alanine N-acetyltransferase
MTIKDGAVLITQRLIIRDHTSGDLPWLCSLFADKAAMRYLPQLYTEDTVVVRKRLDRMIADLLDANRKEFFFCIERRDNRECIGEIGFTVERVAGAVVADAGWFLFPAFWNKGYASEALRAVIDYAFLECAVEKIVATAFRENAASVRVMEKCGMQPSPHPEPDRTHEGANKPRVRFEIAR